MIHQIITHFIYTTPEIDSGIVNIIIHECIMLNMQASVEFTTRGWLSTFEIKISESFFVADSSSENQQAILKSFVVWKNSLQVRNFEETFWRVEDRYSIS